MRIIETIIRTVDYSLSHVEISRSIDYVSNFFVCMQMLLVKVLDLVFIILQGVFRYFDFILVRISSFFLQRLQLSILLI